MPNIDTTFVICQTGLQRRDRRSPCAARQAARLLGVHLVDRIHPAEDAAQDDTGRAGGSAPAFEIWTTVCGSKILVLAARDWLEASLVYGPLPSPIKVEAPALINQD